jgi:hypothetical protein
MTLQMERAWFGLAVVALVLATWGGYAALRMARYDTLWANGAYMRADRWTGAVVVCDLSRCQPIPRE